MRRAQFVPVILCLFPLTLFGQSFTLQQVMSAPFCSHLTASPAKGRVAWTENIEGKRNLFIADPTKDANTYTVRQLTHFDADDGQEITDLEWAPDGNSIAYTRGGDIEGLEHPVPNPALLTEGVKQEVWLASLNEGTTRRIGNGHGAAISPNGDTIVYLMHEQIWSLDLKNPDAKPQRLFEGRGESSSLSWSPDSTSIAFVSNREDHSFIGVYTFATKALSFLYPGTWKDSQPTWSPDSKQVAFLRVAPAFPALPQRWARSADPFQICVSNVATGKTHIAFRATPGQGSLFREVSAKNQLIWSTDGHIVFPWELDGWTHLYSVPIGGGDATRLTTGPFEVEHVTSSGNRIVYDSNQYGSDTTDADRRHIWSIDAAGGTPKALTHGKGVEVFPAIASNGKIVAIHSDAGTPGRPALIDNTGELHDLDAKAIPSTFPAAKMIAPQQVIFPASDGLQIHGQLFLPTDANDGKKHPAIVFFHGGSRRQMLLGWHYMEYYSNTYAMNEYLTSLGYIVLSVNYRSGIGYGMNFRQAENYGFNGASEYRDVEGAGQYLHTRTDVDTKRIGVWGGSYGGYLTALALARASNVFAAGVDLHGVHDWRLEMGFYRSSPDANVDMAAVARTAWESSPMADLKTWRSPVLLIQGDDDRNVVFTQTVRLAAALRLQGVPVEEIVFPDEVHDFLLHRNWITAYTAAAEFFQRKLNALPKD